MVWQETETRQRVPKRSSDHKAWKRKGSGDGEAAAGGNVFAERSGGRWLAPKVVDVWEGVASLWKKGKPLVRLWRWLNGAVMLAFGLLVALSLGVRVLRYFSGPTCTTCEVLCPCRDKALRGETGPLSALSSSTFHALTERRTYPLSLVLSNLEDPEPGEPGYQYWELCPRRPKDAVAGMAPTLPPVCVLMDATEATLNEIEQNDAMRPLPYNMEIGKNRLNQVALILKRMPGRTAMESLEFSNLVRRYTQLSTQTRNGLMRFLVMKRGLCRKISHALVAMGDEISSIQLENQEALDLERKRTLIASAHQHPISGIINNIDQVLSEISSLNRSVRAMDAALLTVANDLHSYGERMSHKVWFSTSRRYLSGWNKKTHAILSEQQTYVSRMNSSMFHLSTSLNDTAENFEMIKSMLEGAKLGLHEYFSGSDVSPHMLAIIYYNLNTVYQGALITEDILNEANAFQQKHEWQLQRDGNSAEIPYSKYKMIDESRPGLDL